ncbi:UNVERIFIED_CONTAM: putative late blight resistance proteinR1A-4 [Sesamum radiatum]|uniref:Late blight resistance proteinR1A-4 n=1 Tax=Sesamum radiatum TaxID=300843 RepID=A0AAW2PHS9_SESRA
MAATAYTALVSLAQTIDQIQQHPRPPLSLDKQQVRSLQDNVAVLQEFLELYSHRLITQESEDGLVVHIADVAHAAEDVIESHIVDQIVPHQSGGNITSIHHHHFYQDLQKVIADMDHIKKEVIEISERMGTVQDPQLRRNSNPAGSFMSASTLQGHKQAMVGCDDVLNELMDKLTGQQSGCRIIPIVGMGGIGKTTLARIAYENPLIVEYFDIRIWVTVSQEYNTQEILSELVSQKIKEISSEEELGEMLYKSLCGRRYLIVMDDMWSIEAWDKLKLFFPNNNDESRIVITTRLSNLALQISGSGGLRMNFLEENKSWDLFCKIVFGEEGGCPLELEEIGKTIAKNCKGLPLSVIVIGGLLAKSEKARDYWEYIAENLSSIVNLEENERCLRILYMSYMELPIHLKSCFLYMGVYPEDTRIRGSQLRRLWVAEGLLKPVSGKSLEEVAKEYMKDLIDRNLMMMDRLGRSKEIKLCKMHDLLRDLCLREAKKERFFCSRELGQDISSMERRIVVLDQGTSKKKYDLSKVSNLAPLVRSLTCDFEDAAPLPFFRLLKVLNHYGTGNKEYPVEAFFKQVNLQYPACSVPMSSIHRFPSSMHLLWNLQTLVVANYGVVNAPIEIWKMHQLKHVDFSMLGLPDPPIAIATGDEIVLPNLQKMLNIKNLKFSEEVVKRIPNIKKLSLNYNNVDLSSSHYCFENVGRLQKLEYLDCRFRGNVRSDLVERLSMLHSLNKLSLLGTRVQWEDITTKIGSLPLLQVLKLGYHSVTGSIWETFEGQFCRLKFLQISCIHDLEYWTVAESSHFPCLKFLYLELLHKLKDIPPSFGEIQTLEWIVLYKCSDSAIISAKEIAEQQEEFGNQDFRVQVYITGEPISELKSLASHNFQVFNKGNNLNHNKL